MEKSQVYEREYKKLTEILKDVDENKRKLIEGLIQDASFLYAENYELRNIIEKTGMIKIHPTNFNLQKQTESGKQYLKNINSYSTVIRTLNSILANNTPDQEDAFDKWVKERMNKDE